MQDTLPSDRHLTVLANDQETREALTISQGHADPIHSARASGPIEGGLKRSKAAKAEAHSDRSRELVRHLLNTARIIQLPQWNVSVNARISKLGWYAKPATASIINDWTSKGSQPAWVDMQLANFHGVPYAAYVI